MRIDINSTVALIVDVQERLIEVMYEKERVTTKNATLVRGLRALQVPLIATEQYPKGLGPTVSSVREAFTDTEIDPSGSFDPIIKSAFSCCDEPAFMKRLDTSRPNGPRTVLIAGIEAHVCVLQTAIDLLENGYTPVIVADALSSRNSYDRDIAFKRFGTEGIRLTTVESVLFELTRVSGTPAFKAISRLIK